MLNLGRLRALCEVADRGTIAAAADTLHLTPSAVSQQLAALERELGERLVEPDGRSVRLTPVANVLVRRAQAIFAEVESMHAEVAAHASGEVADLRIGSFATALRRIVAPAAARVREAAPGIRLAIFDTEAPEAFTMLSRHELDLVLSMEAPGVPGRDDPRVMKFELAADPLDAIVPEGHPLAGEDEVPLTALAGEPWVGPPGRWTCEQVIVGACRAAGFTPDIVHRTGDWRALAAVVAAELGVGLVPRLGGIESGDGAVVVPLAGAPPCRHLFVACRRGAEGAPAMRTLIDALVVAADGSREFGTLLPSAG